MSVENLIKASPVYGVTLLAQRFYKRVKILAGRRHGRIEADFAPVTAGDGFEGHVTISARRALGPAPLTASLVCVELTKTEEHVVPGQEANFQTGGLVTSEFEEIYRHDQNVDLSLVLQADERRTFRVYFPTPDRETGRATDGIVSYWIERKNKVDESKVKRRRQQWTVTVRYGVEGIDLVEEVTIPFDYDYLTAESS